MLRALILLLLISAATLLTAPILLSSLALDERGVSIPGRVFSKSETVTVHYSAWKRSPEVTFSYEPPDNPGIAFFKLTLAPDEYDRLQTGSSVTLHYLR